MTFSKTLLAGVAALALVSCGKKEEAQSAPRTETSQKAAKTSAASPLDSSFKLKNAEAIDVDGLFALMSDDSDITFESAEFDKSIGATVVTNLRFTDDDDGEGVIVERAEFYGVDMDAIERVKNTEDAVADAPFETVFQKVRFFNVSSEGFDNEDAEMKIGGVEFDKLDIRQGGVEGDGVGDEGARFFNAINLAGVYFKDISFSTTSDDAPKVAMSAPDLRFVGFGGGKLNAIIANDLEYEMSQTEASLAMMRKAMGPQGAALMASPLSAFIAPDNQRMTLKSIEWRNIDFSGLLAWGVKDEEPPMTEENLINLGTMKAMDMEMFIGDRRAATIKESTITAADFTWLAPSKFRTDTKGAVYDITAYVPDTEKEILSILNEHGLNKVKGDGYAEWLWNPKSGVAGLDYVANTQGLADFSMNMDFSGFKLSEIAKAKDNGADNPVASFGKFNGFSLKIADDKALDAIFAIAALQMGGTGEDLRTSAPAMIRLSGAQVAQMNPRISDYVNALADFIAKGGTLEINAKPADPVDFTSLQATGMTAPQTLPDVIDLEVTHKE